MIRILLFRVLYSVPHFRKPPNPKAPSAQLLTQQPGGYEILSRIFGDQLQSTQGTTKTCKGSFKGSFKIPI